MHIDIELNPIEDKLLSLFALSIKDLIVDYYNDENNRADYEDAQLSQ